MPQIIQHYIFYKQQNFYASFPSVVALDNGQLLLVFRRARDPRYLVDDDESNDESNNENTKENCEQIQDLKTLVDHIDSRSQLVAIKLNDDLEQIGKPYTLSPTPEAADQDASLLVKKNGDILLSSFSWYHIANRFVTYLRAKGVSINGNADNNSGSFYILWGGFTRISSDHGLTWSDHNYLPHLPLADEIIPGKRHSCGGPSRGQSLEIDDKLILPVYHYLSTTQTDTCHCYNSTDGGKNWQYLSTIAADQEKQIHFQEPSLIECTNGNIMAFMRTAGTGDHLYTAISCDQGKTWQIPQRREEVIGHPTHPLKLTDQRIFISYGYRHQPFGIRARLMDENGENFIGDEIIIRDDGACGDLGYPWAVQISSQQVLVVYYFTSEDGIRHIAGTTVDLEKN